MKKLILGIVVLGIAFTSCDKKNVGAIFDNKGVDYVAVGTTGIDDPLSLTFENNYTVRFPLHRSNLSINGTVAEIELTTDNGTGLFALVDSTIAFANGEGLAYAEIKSTVPASELDPTTVYTFGIKIVGENASTLNNEASFSAQLLLN